MDTKSQRNKSLAMTGIVIILIALSFNLGGLVDHQAQSSGENVRLALYGLGIALLFFILMLNVWRR